MEFESLMFIIFLQCVFVLYWCLPHKYKWMLLLISSYYFYMSWDAKYVVLILFTTVVSYTAARLMGNKSDKKKKTILLISGGMCLCVLLVFKYFNFAFESITRLLGIFAIKFNPLTVNLLPPIGISFYVFRTLSYVIDVYRGEMLCETHFGYYATYVAFFPQLLAGPIERAKNLLPQMKAVHEFDYYSATYGLKLISWGFFKKLCVADVIAEYVDAVYSSLEASAGLPMLMAVFGFTVQIYCDFSGYSDIAIGMAKLFDITLTDNFKSPYYSRTVKEFWSRWHISLSTWFRDYVYIPMGGNRCNRARNIFNIIVTFLLSGLWHGANWTFVAWGAVHGLAQVIEKTFDKYCSSFRKSRSGLIVSSISVFVFCNMAWIFFRADSIKDAFFVVTHLFTGIEQGSHDLSKSIELNSWRLVKIALAGGVVALYDYFSLKIDVIKWIGSRAVAIRWFVYVMLIFMTYLFAHVGTSSFIYAQF